MRVGYTRVRCDPNQNSQTKKDAKAAAWSAGDTVLVVGSERMKAGTDDRRNNSYEERGEKVRNILEHFFEIYFFNLKIFSGLKKSDFKS